MGGLEGFWQAAVVALVVATLLTLRAISPRDARYWLSFSTIWGALALVGTFAVLAAVSALGIAGQRSLTGHSGWASDLTAAAVIHAAARRTRPGTATAGSSLLLGVLPSVYGWVDEHVGAAIEVWSLSLADTALVDVAARLDNRTSGGVRDVPFATRVKHRERLTAVLAAGRAPADEARMQLQFMISDSYRQYRLPKPTLARRSRK
jgi:hypothetical protein